MPANRLIRYAGFALLIATALLVFRYSSTLAQTPTSGQLELGARLFAENCAVCHGENGQGRVGATLAKNWPSIRPDLTVRSIIENGISGSVMPAWGQANGGPLTNEEIDALVEYILSWQTSGPPQFTPRPSATPRPPISPVPNVEGEPNQGAILFDQNCAVCHGANAQGRVGANLSKSWPGIRPDLSIKNTIQNGVSGSVMPAWAQANGGPLSDAEINDLVAFILSLPHTQVDQPAETPAAPAAASWLQGWGGVIVFFVLLVLIVSGALIVQRRQP
jgi:cytochrome c oxidase cbb3-type subunit 3